MISQTRNLYSQKGVILFQKFCPKKIFIKLKNCSLLLYNFFKKLSIHRRQILTYLDGQQARDVESFSIIDYEMFHTKCARRILFAISRLLSFKQKQNTTKTLWYSDIYCRIKIICQRFQASCEVTRLTRCH